MPYSSDSKSLIFAKGRVFNHKLNTALCFSVFLFIADTRASVVQLDDCGRDVYINIPSDSQGYFVPNSNVTLEVSAAGLECLTNLLVTIIKFTLSEPSEECKDYIKVSR